MKQTERKGTLRNIKWQTLIGGSSGYWRFVIGSSNPRTGIICVKYIFTYFRNEPNLRKGIWVISGTMLAYKITKDSYRELAYFSANPGIHIVAKKSGS